MRLKRLLLSLFLLSLVGWTVGGLAGSDGVVIWVSAPDLEVLTPFLAYLRDFISFVILAFMVATAAILVIERRMCIDMLKQAGSKYVHSDRKNALFRSILVFSAFLVSILLLVRFWGSTRGLHGAQTYPSPLPTGWSTEGGNFTSPRWPLLPQSSAFPSFVFSYASTIVFSVIAFVGLAVAIQALREIREEAEEDLQKSAEEETVRASAFKAVQEALASLRAEEDFRAAVIRCYRRLCEILAEHGVQIQNHQTVREFEVAVIDVLEVPRESFAMLTGLFEEARYSLHEMGEAKRDEAIQCLTDVRDHFIREGHC